MSSSLTLGNNNEPFLDWIMTCNEKWILYDNHQQPAQWMDQEAPKHSQSQTWTKKKVMVAVWWSAANLIHYSFLNPSEIVTSDKYAQQISEMHWKLQRLQLVSVNRKDPVLLQDNQHFRSWINWLRSFASSATFTWPTTTSSSILTAFCRGNASTTSRRQKMLSKSSSNPEAQIFTLQE